MNHSAILNSSPASVAPKGNRDEADELELLLVENRRLVEEAKMLRGVIRQYASENKRLAGHTLRMSSILERQEKRRKAKRERLELLRKSA